MAIGAIGILGTVLSAAGTVVGVMGQQKAAAAQAQAEALRKQQMDLDFQRRQRELIREQTVARANVVAGASSQGVGLGSSAVIGGENNITTATNRKLTESDQNKQLGDSMFDANARRDQGLSMAAFGGGLTSLGGGLVNNLSGLKSAGILG